VTEAKNGVRQKMNNETEKGVILIVDDEVDLTKTLKGFFTALGYDMLTAFDGNEAVKAIDSVQNIDLILLDIKMPGVDGVTILKKLRKEHPKTKVIVITAYDKESKAVVEKIGINGFLAKPINMSQLFDRIKYVLKESDKDTRYFPTKEKEEVITQTPKAKILFLEPNPTAFAFMCLYFADMSLMDESDLKLDDKEPRVIKGEYEMKAVYVSEGDIAKEGMNVLYDYQPNVVVMNECLFSLNDTIQFAGLMTNSSHKPKALILHGFLPKTEWELMELRKMGIEFCNQTAIDDKGFRILNKALANFVAKECIKNGLIKK